MHEVMNTTPFSNVFRRAKVALGNTQPRYNSQVEGIREKYYINSTRNSQETPEWMGRTNSHYMKQKMRGRSLHVHDQSNFMGVRQTYVYQGMPKVENKSGQFECVQKKRGRSHWEMKNHTFELQWPKPQEKKEKKEKKSFFQAQRSGFSDSSRSKAPRDFTFYLPKYSIKQSPLHVQKATPLKIGHSTTVDSIYIK